MNRPDCICWLIVSCVVAPLLSQAAANAEDWPTWRHDPLRTAVTNEKLSPPLEQTWVFRSRQSRRAPQPDHAPTRAAYPWVTWYTLPISAAGDSLFFNSAVDGRTVCLDAATGRIRWEFCGGGAMNRTPTFWRGKLYVGSDDGHTYCLDAKTGQQIWKFKAAPADRWMFSYGKPVSAWPVRTDVAVADGVAYFGAGVFPHDGTFMYAVDAETGRLLWRNGTQCETGDRISMSPAGHLFVTRESIFVPKDCWGYFTGWLTLVSFDRATGGPVRTPPGKDEWAGYPGLSGVFLPVMGVKKDKIRYYGSHAAQIDAQDPNKQTQLWREDVADRWTDVDSVLSLRDRRAPIVYRYDPDLTSVVYAGGILYHTAFDVDPQKGTGTGIYARNPQDGKLLWSADVAERANQIIVANGRLFASTRRGTIYCFAPKGTAKRGTVDEPIEDGPWAEDGSSSSHVEVAVDTIMGQAAVRDGYALVLDCHNGGLANEFAKRTKLYVIAVFDDEEEAAAARKRYARHGLHLSRVVAYHRPAGTRLPFPEFCADVVVSEAAVVGDALPSDTDDLIRLVKPMRGVALIGGHQDKQTLERWAPDDWAIIGSGESHWAKWNRPRLVDAGGWYLPHADAGHTNCSRDGVLKPPLGVVWYGAPHLKDGSGAPAGLSVITDGVFFLHQDDGVAAYDQYTGREMWRRGHSRTDMAAAPGSLFLRYLENIGRFDPATGKELHTYLPPFSGGKWAMMAPTRDGKTLYVAADGELPKEGSKEEQWKCIQAIDVATGKARWTLGGPASKKQWGGWSAIGDGIIYYGGGPAEGKLRDVAIAEMRAHLQATDRQRLEQFDKELDEHDFRTFTALDARTGKVLYTHGVDLTNCGGKWLPAVGYGGGRNARHYNPFPFGCTIAHKDVVIFCTSSGADKGWRVWPAGQYNQRAIAVHDGATGKLLWKKPADHRTRPVVVDDTIYAEPWAYDLRTGKRKTRVHPITGQTVDWAWCRFGKQCGIFSASQHFLFGRSTGVGYHDLLTDQGLYTFFHSRMSCSFDAVSGGGRMIKPPMAVYCRCSWSLPFTVALGQVASPPTVGHLFAQPGDTLPVKHLHVDFGATGDRRDQNGNLWLTTNRPHQHSLLLGHDWTLEKYEGAEPIRRNSLYTPVENADVPFVFATALRGLNRFVVPVTTAEAGKGRYLVRLGFSAPAGDQPGQRVFDIKLNGKTVVTDFDILREAGGPDRAVWKEFELEIATDLILELVTKSEEPAPPRMPLICGMQILRKN